MMPVSSLLPLAETSASQMILHSSAALCVVITLLFAMKKILKSLTRGGRNRSPHLLAIQETLVLGPRERLMVAKIGEQHIVIGVTPHAIHPLCTLDPSVATQKTEPSSAFAAQFAQLYARKTP
ncbi:flagellar biosynthetic protein FliO [Rosenbergiella australiborealis]|uniref:Flagellar biosynthetic protein FliO n=1 Tax=Rosenbergiella australiborealis TaxID=1544696 RepID=A0ABS5T7E9_9GAMM|nr:flagellar biosynthetic protein FliO [Rosenbergiella australiborealis]MBT0728309.1 flagellar biosynthetic protein FliO [Rosenbergiella australiborealis]